MGRNTTRVESIGSLSRGRVVLLIGTRKGAFLLRGDSGRRAWSLAGPVFLGASVHHMVMDPRDRRTVLMASRPGHLGPTVFRSTDRGRTWKESTRPPAFPQDSATGMAVQHVFCFRPGHAGERNVWYAGSSPPGLFRSEDGGDTWESIDGFNRHPRRRDWIGDLKETPPGGATLHSIIIDPRDPRHMYIGVSAGGVFETTDGGADWKPLNRGCAADFIPTPEAEYGHDPHAVRVHPLMPDRLYQQNHCGIYRMERPEGTWIRIGANMPKQIGDIGFPIVLHPRNPDAAWVFPMDGTEVWPRTSPGGRPATYVTRDAGKSWKRQDKGLPDRQGWFTVKRLAMAADEHEPVGLYFGTTCGEVWASRSEGQSWACLVRHLPEVYSIEAAEL